ncbi:hypothetical protein HDU97_004850 [Phlyctochytrium planicorne]|nr:hypothetical protein HDU97_004850 [Phlyctochytrium planicorne]
MKPDAKGSAQPSKSHPGRELQTVKDICSNLQALSLAQKKENKINGYKDLNDLQRMTDHLKMDDEMKLIEMETVVSIINATVRKQILRNNLMAHMSDEKEISSSLQQHRDEFSQFIWKRRFQARKDLRALFQVGPGMICRMGDIIADATLELLLLFEKTNSLRLCKDAINWSLCEGDDIPGFFTKKIAIAAPSPIVPVSIAPNRIDFSIPDSAKLIAKDGWVSVYGTTGPWAARLQGKTMVAQMISQSLDRVRYDAEPDDNLSYISFLARILDLAHPSHQLQASVLAYPLHAPTIIKKRLVALKYDIGSHTEDYGAIDYTFAVDIVKQINWRLELEHQFYYEFSYPNHTQWRVGYTLANHISTGDITRYPGQDEWSFGFSFDGSVYYKDLRRPYIAVQHERFFQGIKSGGVLIDLLRGSMSLVLDGKVHPPGFGMGSRAFTPAEQETQAQLLLSSVLIPTFALLGEDQGYGDKPQMRVNFGRMPFAFSMDAMSCDQSLEAGQPKGIEGISIIEHPQEGKEKALQEEEERLQMATEKTYYRAAVAIENMRGFSQFPPNIYRRSLACTKIQRAWRRFRGRRERAKLREMQYMAATLIQRVARRKLRKLRAVKEEAVAKIQKNWRRRMFIWIALMRCIYQQPIPELHRAANAIQRKWRHWSMYRNSPIATRFNARMEDIIAAVNKIIEWWRPLFKRISDKRRMQEQPKFKAFTEVTAFVKFFDPMQQLFRVRAAYILQKSWRNYRTRKIRNEKIRTRNRAAAKIQALWKGYWVRSHVHLRFTYGEAVFLTAVCKALRNCHFIVKMYRPCGIVCPKREIIF